MKRTFTPDLASSLEASSASKGAGMGTTGRSFVEMPLCCRDMCECREFLDLATVPQRTQRYPGHTWNAGMGFVIEVCVVVVLLLCVET